MNSATESPPISTTVLPSPVSVLDSGFDKDESSSPSHSIDYKGTPKTNVDCVHMTLTCLTYNYTLVVSTN